ncbi:reverse transcriptase [Gossypium australe]|uniref:Reverse transcriptase n=1 Tax=Gossypium australe TaxID=47621 RepID=A0A5B6WUL8_9ROSI|nr:reverse transcriptase [Gossypium australe]
MDNIARHYFQHLFTSNGVGNMSRILEGIVPLTAPFVVDEVREALKEMGPTKALGDDGFPAVFFQRLCHIAGRDVAKFFLKVLNEGMGPTLVNLTNIVILPKVRHPMNLVNFRPINLCSVIYKIVAKVLVNRMKGVMDSCINKFQSVFVPGRLISDNALLAYEILHTFRQRRVGKKGFLALKLDMSKAYDRVEWVS